MTATGVNLRGLTARIHNPANIEIEGLIRQLDRIGMRVVLTSADSGSLTAEWHFLFSVVSSAESFAFPSLRNGLRSIIIVIVDSETPTVLDRLAALDIDAVLVNPIRPTGLLATLVQAQRQWNEKVQLRGEIHRLKRKLRGFRNVEKAKEIVSLNKQVSPDQAFAILREHAMRDRTTVECIAQKLVDANRILSAE